MQSGEGLKKQKGVLDLEKKREKKYQEESLKSEKKKKRDLKKT